MSAEKGNDSLPAPKTEEKQSLYWIALFTGIRKLRTSTTEYAHKQMMEWWQYSVERVSMQIPQLPDDFRTTRIWREIKFVDNYFIRLKPVFTALQTGTHELNETVAQLRHIFSEEESRLIKWKQSLENIQGLLLWLPAFSHARDYLLSAFPLGMERPDRLCESLIRSIQDTFPFLEEETRRHFDEKFLEFKKQYIEDYCSLHEEMRHVIRDVKKEQSKVDPVSLRNLALMSGLQYTDKSYLNRVNTLARWIQRNQCTLPVSQILERYPRCYCNFNPCSMHQPTGPANQINGIIQEGIEYYRTGLSQCRNLIKKELKAQKLDSTISEQIESLIGNGAMVPLKEQTVESLNRIIEKNPSYFQAKFRSQSVQDDKEEPEKSTK